MLTSTNSPRRLAAALGAAALLATLPVAAAATTTGAVSGIGAQFFFSDGWHTTAATEVNYGRSDDEFFIGDWDGDGVDTLAVRRGTRFHVSNGFSGGRADTVLDYGRLGDTVLVGDWDGDAADTFAVRRGNVYHLRNTLTGGPAELEVGYGTTGDTVLVGDWDGDGADTLGVRRGNTYLLRNELAGGPADVTVAYGRDTDEVLVGDWDGDGVDTLTARRGNTFHVSNTFDGGPADRTAAFGRDTDTAFAGTWRAGAIDELAVRRATGPVAYPLTGLSPEHCAVRGTLDTAAGTIGVVDCATGHDVEVMSRPAISVTTVSTAALAGAGNRACEAAFSGRTGDAPRTQHELGYTTVYPSPDQYRAGMRNAVCLIWNPRAVSGAGAIR